MTGGQPIQTSGARAPLPPGARVLTFAERFARASVKYGPLALGLDPSGRVLQDWGLEDSAEGLERFVDVVIDATIGSVGVVKPQSAFYERHGWRGARALARLVHECRAEGILVLLDAKRGDVGSTNEAYAEAYFGSSAGIPVDAMTVTAYLGVAEMRPIFDAAAAAAGGVFIVARSSNRNGRGLQEARHAGGISVERQMLVDIANENARLGGGRVGPIGAVFAPTHGPPGDIDLDGMGGLLLAPGVGAQGASPRDVARCFAECPDRVLASASRSLLDAGPTVDRLRHAARDLAESLCDALGRSRPTAQ